MKDDSVPEIVPLLLSKKQAIVEDIEKITIHQLFDVELPMGKAVSYACHFTYNLTQTIIYNNPLYHH